MSETPVEPTPAQGEEAQPATPEVDWKAKSREWERRAKANATAAEKLAEMEEATKTAEQKAAERLAEAERKAAEVEARATRAEVAAETGVPADVLAGPADGSAEAVKAYADKIIALIAGGKRRGDVVPNAGKAPTNSGDSDMREFARSLFDSKE